MPYSIRLHAIIVETTGSIEAMDSCLWAYCLDSSPSTVHFARSILRRNALK